MCTKKEELRDIILTGMQPFLNAPLMEILNQVVVQALFGLEVTESETLPANKGNTLCEVRYADNVAQFQLWQFTTLPRTATVLNLGNYEEKVIGNIFDNPELLEGERC